VGGLIVAEKPDIIIDKVKYDGKKVRIEYQKKRPDNRYDENAIASFDHPTLAFRDALDALDLDVCAIAQFHESYADILTVRGCSFTYTDGIMGACITALAGVKTAKAPLCINTPFLTEGPMNDGDTGPFLDPSTLERIQDVQRQAMAYINGDREQPQLPGMTALETTQKRLEVQGFVDPSDDPQPSGDVAAASALRAKDCAEYARLTGIDLAAAITDPNNPVIQQFAQKFKNCSFTAGGRRLEIDGAGHITATDL
jgi:hypothetical protein